MMILKLLFSSFKKVHPNINIQRTVMTALSYTAIFILMHIFSFVLYHYIHEHQALKSVLLLTGLLNKAECSMPSPKPDHVLCLLTSLHLLQMELGNKLRLISMYCKITVKILYCIVRDNCTHLSLSCYRYSIYLPF